ncbi:MAG: exopolysaccharide biosynthesis polyprenyl glycosylphosphotransferase [Verrucomicrobiota bacterium]
MLFERPQGLLRLHFAIQLFGCFLLLFVVYHGLTLALGRQLLTQEAFFRFGWIFLVGLLIEFSTRSPGFRSLFQPSKRRRLVVSQRQLFIPCAIVLGTMAVFQDFSISRLFLVTFLSAFGLLLIWSNLFLPGRLARWFYDTRLQRTTRTLVIGGAEDAKNFRRRLQKGEFVGIRFVGFVDIDGKNGEDDQVRCLGTLGNLDAICREQRIEAIIVVNSQPHDDIASTLSKFCERHSLNFAILDDLTRRYGRRFASHRVYDVNLHVPFIEPLEDPANQIAKRIFDIFFSLVALLFVFPWCVLLVWTIHRIHSPGRLFFLQDRVGRGGRLFKIVKFRTMRDEKHDQTVQAKKGDSRFFPGAQFLRRSSIDEIPQFWNVFMGDMSVVGPRPHLEKHDEEFMEVAASFPVRRFVKPGITGLAQIKGCRGEIVERKDVRNRSRWDIAYLKQWCLWMDFKIVFMTVVEAIRPSERAY